MKTILHFILVGIVGLLFSCSPKSSPKSSVFIDRDGNAVSAAMFRGKPDGINVFRNWISENTAWPQEFVREGFIVTVKVSFVVDKDGKVTDVTIIDKESVPTFFHKPIYNVLARAPKWTPSYKNGEPVPMRFNINLSFKKPVSQYKKPSGTPGWVR